MFITFYLKNNKKDYMTKDIKNTIIDMHFYTKHEESISVICGFITFDSINEKESKDNTFEVLKDNNISIGINGIKSIKLDVFPEENEPNEITVYFDITFVNSKNNILKVTKSLNIIKEY
jgi:hypothetical protein